MSHKKAKRQRQERRRTSEEMRAALAEQLASMIGCKRVAVTRAFRKLEVGGAVQLKDRRIVVRTSMHSKIWPRPGRAKRGTLISGYYAPEQWVSRKRS